MDGDVFLEWLCLWWRILTCSTWIRSLFVIRSKLHAATWWFNYIPRVNPLTMADCRTCAGFHSATFMMKNFPLVFHANIMQSLLLDIWGHPMIRRTLRMSRAGVVLSLRWVLLLCLLHCCNTSATAPTALYAMHNGSSILCSADDFMLMVGAWTNSITTSKTEDLEDQEDFMECRKGS